MFCFQGTLDQLLCQIFQGGLFVVHFLKNQNRVEYGGGIHMTVKRLEKMPKKQPKIKGKFIRGSTINISSAAHPVRSLSLAK